eukprot:SAG22_NODE_11450_length_484_cov_1.605195_1_plen_45_part_10
MVIVDRFSKKVFTVPTWKTSDAKLAAELFIKHIVMERGVTIEVVS